MMSKRIVMTEYGPPSVLRWESAELSPLAPGEVRIQTIASAVNHSDLEIRAGNWPILRDPPFPYVPGLEVVGDVVEVGSAVHKFAIGDRVTTMMQGLGGVRSERPGGYAEHVTVDASAVARVPAELDPIELAAIGLAGVTAWGGLAKLQPLQGAKLVVTGAGGGVGSAAVALGAFFKAEVVAVASRAEQRNYLLELGAREVIAARTAEELAPYLKPWTTDAVLDTVAGPLFPILVKSLQHRGRLCLVGAIAGGDVGFDVWHLTHDIVLTGYSTEYLDGTSLGAAIEAMSAAGLRAPARTIVPLREAARAHELLEAHQINGRVVLVP